MYFKERLDTYLSFKDASILAVMLRVAKKENPGWSYAGKTQLVSELLGIGLGSTLMVP